MHKSVTILLFFLFISKLFGTDINELPMYGKVKKTEEQIKADKSFISAMLQKTGDLKKASRGVSKRAWEYIRQNDYATAIKRLNQAWLLDSTNAEAYWGFAVYVGQQGNTDESVQLMEKACSFDSLNGELWADFGFALARLGASQKEKSAAESFYNRADRAYRRSIALKPEYCYQYFQWAILKFYQGKYSEAWPLISSAEQLGVMDLDQRFLKDLESKVKRPANLKGWSRYQYASLNDIQKNFMDLCHFQDTNHVKFVYFDNAFRSSFAYLDSSREITANQKLLIEEWFGSQGKSGKDDFKREYLFKQGDKKIWLPVQDKIAGELHKGVFAELYCLLIGAINTSENSQIGLIVNAWKEENMRPEK